MQRSALRSVALFALLLSGRLCLGAAVATVSDRVHAQTEPRTEPHTSPAPNADKPATTSPPMTAAQRKELLDAVDPMTQFVSTDSALPIRHRVKRQLISRADVGHYLNDRFKDDESAKRLERSELVLKKFGLLDRNFDLGPFLVSLLTEQIAGFYDNKTKTVNLLDWVAPSEQKPVLAHELTHALQDQTVNLEKWSDSGVHDTSHTAKDDRRHVATDELETAREAVAEGQAMVVFYDDAMRGSGKTLAAVPANTQLLDADAEDKGSPVLARAPLLLRESLLFPYTDGLRFEHTVLLRRGKQGAFADVLTRPPSTSYEIMHPAAYLAGTPVPSLPMPDVHPLLDAAYEPYDVGAMGELDVRIFAEVLGGRSAADRLSPAWQGGVYYAAQRRSASDAAKKLPGSIAIVYQSRWRTPDDAHSFAALYALGLHHKYSAITRRSEDETLPGEQIYTTPEGDAVLFTTGNDLFLTEGLPLALSRQLRPLFGDTGASGPQLQARLTPAPHPQAVSPLHEPSLGLTGMLGHIAGSLRGVSP